MSHGLSIGILLSQHQLLSTDINAGKFSYSVTFLPPSYTTKMAESTLGAYVEYHRAIIYY